MYFAAWQFYLLPGKEREAKNASCAGSFSNDVSLLRKSIELGLLHLFAVTGPLRPVTRDTRAEFLDLITLQVWQ